jgi:hypothetical protein
MGMTHREEIDKEASVVDDRRAHTKDPRSKEDEGGKDRKKAETYRRSYATKGV